MSKLSNLATLLTVIALFAAGPAPSAASVYWANAAGTTIGRANADGTGANQTFIDGVSHPEGVAVDAAHIYWTNRETGTIGRANLDGTAVDQNFITGANSPSAVAVDGAHVYWTDSDVSGQLTAGRIGRANLDGSGVELSFITGADAPSAIAVDSGHVYWANLGNRHGIGRANLDGSGVNQAFIGGEFPCALAVDDAHIYWSGLNTGAIARANLDGSGIDEGFIAASFVPCGLAVDSAHIYWANDNPNADDPAGDAIGRANLDGSGIEQRFIDGPLNPLGVAVDRPIDTPEPARISVDDVITTEGDAGQTAARFAISLDRAEPGPVTVDFAAGDGTATAPSDYAPTSGTVTFAPGQTARTVTVEVNGDTTVEPDETFNLDLANATGNATLADARGVGTILNDDRPVTDPPPVSPPPPVKVDPPPAQPPIAGGAGNPLASQFTLGKVRLNPRTGTARIAVTVPGPGRLALSVGTRGTRRAATRSVRTAGTVQLVIKASGRDKRTLARMGRVTVRVSVTYTPIGGSPRTRSRNVRLTKAH